MMPEAGLDILPTYQGPPPDVNNVRLHTKTAPGSHDSSNAHSRNDAATPRNPAREAKNHAGGRGHTGDPP